MIDPSSKPTNLKKFLNKKISALNEIVADLDSLVMEMGQEFYRVSIFGSARILPNSPEYNTAFDLAYRLASEGCDIVTGGGPGLMEAANKGAKKARGKSIRSIGLSIDLPFEVDANSHLDVKYHHRKFSSRLDEFMRISQAVVITPGGIGTVLELFFTWQLIQVGHTSKKPILLLGKDMWQGLIDWMIDQPLQRSLLSKEDIESVKIVDSVDEVLDYLKIHIAEFNRNLEAIVST